MRRLIWLMMATGALVWAQDKQAPAGTNVEFTVYLISGSGQGTTDEVPKDLEPTVKQLHSVFAYKSYKLSESFILRGGAGVASTEGILPGVGLRYRFGYFRYRLSGDAPRAVQIEALYLELTKPAIGLKDGKQI